MCLEVGNILNAFVYLALLKLSLKEAGQLGYILLLLLYIAVIRNLFG